MKGVILHQIPMRVPVVVGVISAGIDLDKSNSSFDETPREEALLSEVLGLLVLQSVELADVKRFIVKGEGLGSGGLHPKGQFVTLDARGKLGVLWMPLQMVLVQLIERADEEALLGVCHALRWSQVEDG